MKNTPLGVLVYGEIEDNFNDPITPENKP